MVIARTVLPKLREVLGRFPAVALLGPRQSGKTTLARMLAGELGGASIYLDLELPADRAKLTDPELYFADHQRQLVILDEIHRAPNIFPTLRGVIDGRSHEQGPAAGQFLLLGSASMDLLKQSSESLAGRIIYQELTPLTVGEISASDADEGAINRLWVRGGFPRSFLAASDESSLEWRQAFIQTYLERDIPALGPRVPAETLHRFWQMLAHNQGSLLNVARLSASLGVTGQTVTRYLDILVDLLLVRRLQPWASNAGKRLVRSPKTYVRDSGIVHALQKIGGLEDLLGHPVAGGSWEGWVIENVLASAKPSTEAWFYRTSNGAEIDLLIQPSSKELWAIEVKRSLSPHPSSGFHRACEDVKATRRIVVYPGKERYRLDAVTEVCPVTGVL